MKRLLVVIAACATPAAPERDRVAASDDDIAPIAVPMRFATTEHTAEHVSPAYTHERTPLPARAQPAIPGDMIRALAVTDDSAAVVSVDNSGGVRLWPALDGTREPVIVAMRAPRMLAIAHVGSGFVIAGVDELGQLELVRATGEGASEERVAVATPRPIVAVRVVTGGPNRPSIVAERDDHVIAVFDPHGELRGELVPGPGERVVDLPARRDRVLALLERDGVVRGRWLELGERVAWGARTARLPIDARPVALAPDGTRIAATRKRGRQIVVVSLARGNVIGDVIDQQTADPTAQALGFVDDHTFVFIASQSLSWSTDGRIANTQHGFGTAMAIADTQIVFSGGVELELFAPGNIRHVLGYRSATLTQVLADDSGWLASSGNDAFTLGADLQVDQVLDASDAMRSPYGWRQLTLLDRHAALANGNNNNLAIVDLDGQHKAVATGASGIAGVDPRTGLVVSWAAQKLSVARFDVATHTLSKFVALPEISEKHTWYSANVVLLDPDVTGNVAAIVEYGGDNDVKITDVVGFDPGADEPFRLGKSRVVTMTDEQRNTGDPRTLVPGELNTRRTSPDGMLVAQLANNRLTLRARGKLRWTVPSNGATSLAWSPSGELVVYGSGAARVDVATGALLDRVCGWQFGLWNTFTGSFGGAQLCQAP